MKQVVSAIFLIALIFFVVKQLSPPFKALAAAFKQTIEANKPR